MRLWLDDIRPMPEDFDFAVTTAQCAINELSGDNVDFISFDHDLGDEHGTGYTVACWIERAIYNRLLRKCPDYAIHSANPVGRENIRRAMEHAKQLASDAAYRRVIESMERDDARNQFEDG